MFVDLWITPGFLSLQLEIGHNMVSNYFYSFESPACASSFFYYHVQPAMHIFGDFHFFVGHLFAHLRRYLFLLWTRFEPWFCDALCYNLLNHWTNTSKPTQMSALPWLANLAQWESSRYVVKHISLSFWTKNIMLDGNCPNMWWCTFHQIFALKTRCFIFSSQNIVHFDSNLYWGWVDYFSEGWQFLQRKFSTVKDGTNPIKESGKFPFNMAILLKSTWGSIFKLTFNLFLFASLSKILIFSRIMAMCILDLNNILSF